MSSVIHFISVENNIPLCLGVHVGLPFFFLATSFTPAIYHVFLHWAWRRSIQDSERQTMFHVVHSPFWILPGHVNFIPLILSANMFPFTFIFPKVLCSLILAVALSHQYYWFIPCHTLKLHFNISVGILEKWGVRTYWVCNLVLEIYNVLLYSEASSP